MWDFFLGMLGGVIGVVAGSLVTLYGVGLKERHSARKKEQRDTLLHVKKEIDTLLLLNEKIQNIIQHRGLTFHFEEIVSFDQFDDVYITIEDYIYLKSFCAQNNYYLPKYIVEEFFKEIAYRQMVTTPEQMRYLGGYTYRGGRIALEDFSDELLRCVEDRKIQLKQIQNHEIPYFH